MRITRRRHIWYSMNLREPTCAPCMYCTYMIHGSSRLRRALSGMYEVCMYRNVSYIKSVVAAIMPYNLDHGTRVHGCRLAVGTTLHQYPHIPRHSSAQLLHDRPQHTPRHAQMSCVLLVQACLLRLVSCLLSCGLLVVSCVLSPMATTYYCYFPRRKSIKAELSCPHHSM